MTPAFRRTCVVLAVVGAIVPMAFIGRFLSENGWDFSELPAAWTANFAAAGAAWDLTISAVVLALWVVVECRANKRWRGLWAIPATFCIGVSCGLPLYLLLREPPRNGRD